MTYTLEYLYFAQDTDYQTTTVKLDFNFYSQIWVNITPSLSYYSYYEELYIDYGLYYSYANDSVKWINHQKPNWIPSYDVSNIATVISLKDWIWPRLDTSLLQWSFPLPVFTLGKDYSIKIGIKSLMQTIFFILANLILKTIGTNQNITKLYTINPFDHCQNSKYTIFVIDMLTNTQPSWIWIDQQNKTVSINTTNIFNVQIFQLKFYAKLITFSIDQNDRYTTQNSL